jgi:tRNA(His) 5'-end guanylyltransferase
MQPPIDNRYVEKGCEFFSNDPEFDKIGQVIYRAAYNPDYSKPWDKVSEATRYKYRGMAKAAIEALQPAQP